MGLSVAGHAQQQGGKLLGANYAEVVGLAESRRFGVDCRARRSRSAARGRLPAAAG